jgi:NlpC/P60 family putative phage cell wall peptidase
MIEANDIITAARGWIGTPYRHQASLQGVGCDCLGLVRGIWRDVYGAEPEAAPAYSPDWAEATGREQMAHAARRHMLEIDPLEFAAGDLLLFRWKPWLPAKHAGIATARDHMIHAQDGYGVCEVPISFWWRRHLAFAFRFPVGVR